MNRNEFIDIMSGIMEMYPGRFDGLGNLAMEMWYEALSDLDFTITKKAVVNHIKASKFPPTVADIREQYAKCKEKQKEYVNALDNIFKEMKENFPSGDVNSRASNYYYQWLCEVEPSSRLESANKLRNKVIAYVRGCEDGSCVLDMTLFECIKGMVMQL